jgi:hypothetical protein
MPFAIRSSFFLVSSAKTRAFSAATAFCFDSISFSSLSVDLLEYDSKPELRLLEEDELLDEVDLELFDEAPLVEAEELFDEAPLEEEEELLDEALLVEAEELFDEALLDEDGELLDEAPLEECVKLLLSFSCSGSEAGSGLANIDSIVSESDEKSEPLSSFCSQLSCPKGGVSGCLTSSSPLVVSRLREGLHSLLVECSFVLFLRPLLLERCSLLLERRSLPSDLRSLLLERRSLPSERRSLPSERRSLPSDLRSLLLDLRSLLLERRSLPSERRSLPSERGLMSLFSFLRFE